MTTLSRLLLGAALLLALAAAGACDKAGDAPTTSTPASSPTAAPRATPSPVTDLANAIGVRADLPQNDPIALAARYGLTQGPAPAARPFAGEPNIGDTREFFVQRISGAAYSGRVPPENATTTATLVAKSAHAYFYVDNAVDVADGEAQAAADDFEASVWPKVTSIFGTPRTPGVDGDPRIVVLQADLGGAVGGYYSPDDGYVRAVRPLSNEAEMVYLDRSLRLGGAAFSVVLAHELQHLIHDNIDAGEEAWVNEGLAEAASGLVGGALSSVSSFAARPDVQLNDWSSDDSSAHYGASAAFLRYVAYRFGGDPALGAIARESGDGPRGVDQFLAAAAGGASFEDAFRDWITANILERVDGPYANPGEPLDVRVDNTLAPGDSVDDEASQFGADYYMVGPLDPGEHTLTFSGARDVPALAADAGGAMLWSNAEDDVDTTLTRELDLTGAVSPALTFRTWFDIEPWYDWGYVSISTDGGASWRALAGEQTRDDDPVEAAYGPGYSGRSGGGETPAWVDERIDLAPFAGQKVLLRFEYVTDGSTHRDGWAIDDLALEGADAGIGGDSLDGWQDEGWVRVDRPLPQRWIVRLIAEQADGEPFVRDATVDASGAATLRFDPRGLRNIVIAIAGATEGTTQASAYHVEFSGP